MRCPDLIVIPDLERMAIASRRRTIAMAARGRYCDERPFPRLGPAMSDDRSTEETVVVAAYPSRHDAEMARDLLGDHGIKAFVAADDVHPPLQMTEGARLLVMAADAWTAHEVLDDAEMLPPTAGALDDDDVVGMESKPISLTAWLFIAAFVLVLALVAIGSLM